MTAPTCDRRRPDDTDDVGPGPERSLLLMQSWDAPSGVVGELVAEAHEAHVHLWWRWDGNWNVGMDGDEDWNHFLACVWPVARDVITALRGAAPLDLGSASILAEIPR